MADYRFVTLWQVDAPIEQVWDAIVHSERWPSWWKSVKSVTDVSRGDENGIGTVRRYSWTTHLPYTLDFDMRVTRIEKPYVLEGQAMGELSGMGRWELTPHDSHTDVRYIWEVHTTKAWMNALAPVARPVFAWNHDAVMNDGAAGLAKLLNTKVVVNHEEQSH